MDHLVCLVLLQDVDRFIFGVRGVMDNGPTAEENDADGGMRQGS